MKYFLIILLFIFSCNLYSQEYKRNNNWVVGFQPVVKFDFNNTNILFDTMTDLQNTSLDLGASCISDTNGNLLFYCGGFIPYDNKGITLDSTAYLGYYINCALGNKFIISEGGGGIGIK